ncbi:MAG: hypothetical protein LBQ10_05010 [Desulfovibrio sp.]|jgi:hypothetical protein|nr:hypothetical protein [Desulfovibrio sp.]
MATREQCVRAAMAGGLQRAAAVDVVNAMLNDRAAIDAAKAQGRIANADAAMAEAWAKRMAEAEIQTAVARKQAAINILRRREIDARFAAVKAEGFTGRDALEALLVGSNKRFTGARDSIDAASEGIRKDFLGSLINDLENVETAGKPVRKLLTGDSEFNSNVVREMISPGSTRDATAAQVADIFGRHLEKARLRMNDAGAYIGKLDGYVPQSHDPLKLTATRPDGKTPRQGWKDSIRDKLDARRTFGDATPEEVEAILDDIYDNIVLGKDSGPSAAERGIKATPGSQADRLSRGRVLHFRDADAWMAYHEEFGRGGTLSGVLTHMSNAARSLALMERLGPNPEAMIKSVIASEARALREAEAGGLITNEGMSALADLRAAEGLRQGKVANWWAELTGQANWPLSGKLARFASIARATQTLSKLGGASLSAVSDVFVKAMSMRNVSGMNWDESVARSLGQYFRLYPGKKKETARQLGAFIDDVANDFRMRWDVSETRPGFLGSLQDKLFKWSGLNWITESGKAGYANWFSGYLGEAAAKTFDQLDASRVATLTYHGIDARKWEAMRHMTETMPDGRQLLVPDREDGIPDGVLRELVGDEWRNLRRDFARRAEYPLEEWTNDLKGWPEDFPKIRPLTNTSVMKNHPDYAAAKAGDGDAAYRLVRDVMGGETQQAMIRALAEKYPDAVLVAVHAEERAGKNQIPRKLADYIGEATGLEVDPGIVQSRKVSRTGTGAWHRMAHRPKFDGRVQAGRGYIIVDDMVVQGGTVSELRQHIEAGGGEVADIVSMGAGRNSSQIALTRKTRLDLERRHGVNNLRKFLKEHDLYGGEHQHLTESEARFLLRGEGLDAARDRIAAARQHSEPSAQPGVLQEGRDQTDLQSGSSQDQVASSSYSPLPPDSLSAFSRAERALLDRARNDLRTRAMSMIADETRYAIPEPDAKARAFMRQGTRPGTVAGEFWRTIMQFKSFPITYMQRQFGGRRWVRGELQRGMRYGFSAGSIADAVSYDPRGVVGAALASFAFGYVAMTLKDMAKGRTPRDPRKMETIFAALVQSGGAGIFGDFFFSKASRFGDSFAGTLAGPLPGEVGRLLTSSVPSLLRGDWEAAGEDTLRTVLDNVPFINFWYTREAVNWLALYHLREMMSPGTLARTERKLKQDFDQTYIISPAQNIRRGGWRQGLNDWR